MKKNFLLIPMCVLAVACTNKPANSNTCEAGESSVLEVEGTTEGDYNYQESEKLITKSAEEFLSAIEKHDLGKALTFFSPEYVAEQHDNFLKGNTEQFFTEFFASEYSKEDGTTEWKNDIQTSDIVVARLVSVSVGDEPEDHITVELELKDGKKYTTSFTMFIDEDGKAKFVAAVG